MRSGPSCSIEQASNGGHTVSFRKPEKPSKGNGIGNYEPPESRVYGKGEHEKMIGDVRKHLGVHKKASMPAPKAASMARNMVSDRDKDGY